MTITEIAKLAGVSIGTVDRVLHNRGRVSPETEKRIRAIVKKYDYQPDPLARHLKKHTKYKIGVLLPSLDTGSGYWNKVYEGIENYIRNDLVAFSFSLEPFFFERKEAGNIEEQFKAMLNSDCNAYVIAPVLQKNIRDLLIATKISKPFCFVDSSIPDIERNVSAEKLPLSVITQNPYKAGFIAGKLTQMIGSREGTYIVLEVYGSAYNQNERARGFCAWFENKKSCRAVHVVVENNMQSMAASIKNCVENLFKQYNDISGICTVSVEVQFVADFIREANIKNVTITGFDLIDENIRLLKSDEINCLIDQKPIEQGRLAINQLYRKLVYEENPVKKTDIPIEIYFKENLL